jgi:basic membrane protein A
MVLLVSLVLTGCGQTSVATKAPEAKKLRIGLVFDVGGRGDKSFNDSAYAGVEAARKELSDQLEIKVLEPVGSGENREQLLRLLAQDKYDLIFGIGFMFPDAIRKVAKDFPQTKFALVDGYVPGLKPDSNITCLLYREQEGAFLVGAMAAMKSSSGKIGFVGGMQIPLIEKFEAGYTAGARYINPDIRVFSDYVGTTGDAFKDPVKGKELALRQLGAGADVLFAAAGSSGLGVLDAVVGQKKWFIGVDSDQSLNAGVTQRPFILTSLLKRVDVAVQDTIRSTAAQKFTGGYQEFGVRENGVGYADNEYNRAIVAPFKSKLEEIRNRIIAGDIKIPIGRKDLK